jgi:hypothetical protein
MKFDEDGWSSKSQKPPMEIEEGEKLVFPNSNLKSNAKSDSDQ